MANSQLKGQTYTIEPEYIKYLGTSQTYEGLKMRVSRMTKAQSNPDNTEFNNLGGTSTLTYAKKLLSDDRNNIKNQKNVCTKTGLNNCYLDAHEKDKNANPTGVGGNPLMHKGSINKKIMTNKEVYNEGFLSSLGFGSKDDSNLPLSTKQKGIHKIANIDDMKDLISVVLPERCYKKRYDSNSRKFIIYKLDKPSLEVIIDNRHGKLRLFYSESGSSEQKLKSFDVWDISDIETYLRKIVEFTFGRCFDTEKMNEEINSARYLIEYMTNNKKKII